MNEYDDILNRIVEEFYDTGRLVLNEQLDASGRSRRIGKFFILIKSVNELFREHVFSNECTENRGGVENCIRKFRVLGEISNIWYKKVIPQISSMDSDEKQSLSRGGNNEYIRFRNYENVDEIEELVEIINGGYLNDLRNTYQSTVNKIHAMPVQISTEVRKDQISKYEELRDIIINDLNQLPYQNTRDVWLNIINVNIWLSEVGLILRNIKGKSPSDLIRSFEQLKFKLLSFNDKIIGRILKYYDRRDGWDIKTKEELIGWIDNNIKNQKEKIDNAYKIPNTDNTGIDTLKDYLEYKSIMTQQKSEESFDELVNDIGVEIVNNEDFPYILSNYVIDKELLEQRKEILDLLD